MSEKDLSKANKKSTGSLPKAPSGAKIANENDPYENSTAPDFIYGGPFIKLEKPSILLDTATPMNLQLQGTFKKSFAYYTLKERIPVILTKVIDHLSRNQSIKSMHGASDQEIRDLIHYISKLKNDLITNKKYDLLQVDTPEARQWNEWIQQWPNQYYFTNVWVYTECYVYRRLREGCELQKNLQNFDPFFEQKVQAYQNAVEAMCVVANHLVTMLPPSDKDKRKADFVTLVKTCLWANKCDLSLSAGEQVDISGHTDGKVESAVIDPFQMILDFKDMILVDDSSKAYDTIVTKAEAIAKAISADEATAKKEEVPPPTATEGEKVEPAAEEPKIPCPAKMTVPTSVMLDIVCDNSGYELFSDLCLAHFMISQKIVQKVRFHVKKIPWFVSDVTPKDFKYVIEQCRISKFSRTVAPAEPKPDAVEGEVNEPSVIDATNLQKLGEEWTKFVEDGIFVVMNHDFWTSPHVFADMKKHAPSLYRNLQFAAAIVFKGDLNYRKLLCEKNCNPTMGFEAALQGFNPAPLLAVRTVKADLICGLPKGKAETLDKLDEKWMQTGDYGLIQFCAKTEPLKPSEQPCADYGEDCRGIVCPKNGNL